MGTTQIGSRLASDPQSFPFHFTYFEELNSSADDEMEGPMAQVVMPPSRRKFSRRSEERLRTQRVVNLRLLLVSALLATTASVFGFVWYRYRSSQVGQAFEIRATALE